MKYFRLKYGLFVIRILIIKIKYWRNTSFNSIKVGFERDIQLIISGKNSSINFGYMNYFYRFGNIEVLDGGLISFGSHVSINKGFSIVCRNNISFGDNIIIGPNVMIYDHDHNFEVSSVPFRLQDFSSKPISIASNVWIGAQVFIGSGVSIGENAVIGAGAVVTKDVSSNCLVAGNPSRVIKKFNASCFS